MVRLWDMLNCLYKSFDLWPLLKIHFGLIPCPTLSLSWAGEQQPGTLLFHWSRTFAPSRRRLWQWKPHLSKFYLNKSMTWEDWGPPFITPELAFRCQMSSVTHHKSLVITSELFKHSSRISLLCGAELPTVGRNISTFLHLGSVPGRVVRVQARQTRLNHIFLGAAPVVGLLVLGRGILSNNNLYWVTIIINTTHHTHMALCATRPLGSR